MYAQSLKSAVVIDLFAHINYMRITQIIISLQSARNLSCSSSEELEALEEDEKAVKKQGIQED